MTHECAGVVRTLHDQIVLVSGAVSIDGRHITQAKLKTLLEDSWVRRVLSDKNKSATLFVQGALWSGPLKDRVNHRSDKGVFVAAEREEGNHIHVVDSAGLQQLLEKKPAPCLQTKLTSRSEVEFSPPPSLSPIGGIWRRRETTPHAPTGLELDLSGLDRGTAAHEDLVAELVRFLGTDVYLHSADAPQFDAAWADTSAPERLYVVEAKSLTGVIQDQQIRLGIGQLLDYTHTLRSQPSEFSEFVPVLLLQKEPQHQRWESLCASLGILLTYPPGFPQISQGLNAPGGPQSDLVVPSVKHFDGF